MKDIYTNILVCCYTTENWNLDVVYLYCTFRFFLNHRFYALWVLPSFCIFYIHKILMLTVPTRRSLTYEKKSFFFLLVQKPNERIGTFISYESYSEPKMESKIDMHLITLFQVFVTEEKKSYKI